MRTCVMRSIAAAAALLVASLAGQAASGSLLQPTVVSERPAPNTPNLVANEAVPHPLALAGSQSDDGTMFVGGRFTAAQDANAGSIYPRHNLLAFNIATGGISSDFAPDADAPVFSVLAVADGVYVGGEFTSINGVARPGLAKLNPITGTVIRAFKPFALSRGRVSEIRLVNSRLLVSGSFAGSLLALDPATGANTNYLDVAITGRLPLTTTKTDVAKFAVNPRGTRLVAVGNFTAVNGHVRKRAFMLNLRSSGARLADWYYAPLNHKCRSDKPSHQPYLQDVDFSPHGGYFVFVSTGYVPLHRGQIGISLCDAAARFETTIASPTRPTWINYTGGDTLYSVAATGAAVYVQGHNRWLDNPYGRDFKGTGAVTRRGLGAIDSGTGKALAWNPSKPALQGGHDLLATADGLWVMSDSKSFAHDYHRGIAFAPLPPLSLP